MLQGARTIVRRYSCRWLNIDYQKLPTSLQLLITMSQLLLSTDEWIYNQFQPSKSPNLQQRPNLIDQKEFGRFDAKLLRHLLPHREFTQVATVEDYKCKKYTILLQNISKRYKGLLSFIYFKQEGRLSIFFQLLNLNGRIFKLQTSQMLTQLTRAIHLAQRSSAFPLKKLVNYDSFQISFEITYFSYSRSNLIYDLESTNKYTNIVVEIYKNFMQKNLSIIEKTLDIVVPLQEKLEQQQQKKLVQNLFRYTGMMTMKSNFSMGEIVSQEAKAKYLRQRQQSGRRLQMKKQFIEPETIKHFQLYGNSKIKREDKGQKNKNQFQISRAQEKIIKKEISFQLAQTQQASKKFMTFLNPIKIHQPQKLTLYPLNSGGYAQIFSAEVAFWQAGISSAKDSPNLDPKDMHRKIMAVKKSKQISKNLHEVRILSQLKIGYIPLLPKYYLPMNVPNNPIEKNPLLMMDMLIYGNLADFMKNKKKSISLNGKLVLMTSITMGLRFLEKFKIVHLDFKPSNIMMSPGLMIKIIDFGQAYHSEVVKKEGFNYRPGTTLPYSPPEASLGRKYEFTSKSGIYSLGVIFYELIFGKKPFENRQKFYLASEQCDKYGDILIIRVLNWMISRCLSIDPEERPQLQWISMILRICMYLII